MHSIGRGAGTIQAGRRSPASTLDFGVPVALGQAPWLADRVASDEERQMTLCLRILALRLQDCAC
jgi:hypothetical protein